MIKIVIPEVCPTLNKFYSSTIHWSKRNKIKDRWQLLIKNYCRENEIKPVKIFPVTIITQTKTRVKRSRDTSNNFPSNKLGEDSLIKAGIIPNDTPQYVNQHIILKQKIGCKDDETIIIVVDTKEQELINKIVRDLLRPINI